MRLLSLGECGDVPYADIEEIQPDTQPTTEAEGFCKHGQTGSYRDD